MRGDGSLMAPSLPLHSLIHPSAQKWNSAKFTCRILHRIGTIGSESAYGPTPKR